MSYLVANVLDTALGAGFYNMTLGAMPTVSTAMGNVGTDARVVAGSIAVVFKNVLPLMWSGTVLGISFFTNLYVIGTGVVIGVVGSKVQKIYERSITFKRTIDLT
jgi:hypothetical protein